MVSNFDSSEKFLQISLKADERDVYEFFSRAGKVSSVAILYTTNGANLLIGREI
jgi:hypothetical protein